MHHLDARLTINKDLCDAPNLCDRLSAKDLQTVSLLVDEGFKRDLTSRIAWERRMNAGMDMAMQIQTAKNWPWTGCSNVVFPLITIAALQFSARAYSNIIQGTDVVRYRVVGEDKTGIKRARADRISKHMSWQVLEEDVNWEEQHDRLLINLAIVGANFTKSYFSPRLQHNVSELVLARDFVIDYWAKSVEGAARKTHIIPLYPNEIYERAQAGIFCKALLDSEWFNSHATIPLPNQPADNRQGLSPPPADRDTPFSTLEQHRLLDLDGDGYAEPYIVTTERNSKEVVRIVARFGEDQIERRGSKILRIQADEYFTKYSFIPAADGGIYDTGFGVLLGPINESVSSAINQIIDSGTFQNSIGGFLGRGAKIRGGVYTMAPWEWKRVDSTGDDLRKNLVPFPERQPSEVLFKLLGLLIEYADRITGATEQMTGVSPGQNTPAETARTTTEQGMQIYSVIFKRVWRSMKEEFGKLHRLNAKFLPSVTHFGDGQDEVRREDYKDSSDHVVPVADPHITSKTQRIAQATAVRDAAHMVAGYDTDVTERRWLRALGVDGVDEVYLGKDKTGPLPNPKVMVEQIKAQIKDKEFEHQKQLAILEIMSEREETQARILKLRAEAAKLVADIGVDKAAKELEYLQIALDAFQKHNEMLNDRLKVLMGGSNEGGGNPDGGGVPRLAGPQGNSGVPAAPAGVGAGP